MRRPISFAALFGVLGLAFTLAATMPGQRAQAQMFEPETFTLDNGLKVVVVTNHRAPVVTQMLWYKAGSADDPQGLSGMAHIAEHMMFKGTERFPDDTFSRTVSRLGGRENAFTARDYTGYFQSVASEHLEVVMEMEADRMKNTTFTQEQFDNELLVVLEERFQRVDNNPSAQLNEVANATLHKHHPYGTPIIGWESEIRAATPDDVRAFHEEWYAPDNAVLIVAGDITAEEVRPLAEEHYGGIEPSGIGERQRLQEPPHIAPRRVEMESPRVQQPSLSIQYLAPSYRTAEDHEAYALQVLNEILGGGQTSRFYRALVIDQGIAAAAGSWYSAHSWDETSFGFYGSPRPGVEVEDIEAALRAEIRKLLDEGVSEAEVEDAQQRLRANSVYARDDVSTAARVIGRAVSSGQSVADVEAWPERVARITAEDVDAVARQVLREPASVTAVLKSEPTS